MGSLTAYGVVFEGITGKVPVEESIESIIDEVDSFIIVDASKYDRWNGWHKYSKVKYIKTEFPIHDNPFGALWTLGLKNVNTEYAWFVDLDEILELPSGKSIKEIMANYDLNQYAISFRLIHYYCSRNFAFKPEVVPTKGASIFKTSPDLIHDFIPIYTETDGFKRYSKDINLQDGVRIVNTRTNGTLEHYPTVDMNDAFLHHLSHLDYYGKIVKSFNQMGHVLSIDSKYYYPNDIRLTPEIAAKIYEAGEEQIEENNVEFFQQEAVPYDYISNVYVDRYIEKYNIKEFNPYEQKGYKEKYGDR